MPWPISQRSQAAPYVKNQNRLSLHKNTSRLNQPYKPKDQDIEHDFADYDASKLQAHSTVGGISLHVVYENES
jgi:type IV secretory pathway TrbF-like protein